MDIEVLRYRFVKEYAAVPAKLREEIVVLVDDKPFNWNTAFIEVSGKTRVGEEILKRMESIGLLREKGDANG